MAMPPMQQPQAPAGGMMQPGATPMPEGQAPQETQATPEEQAMFDQIVDNALKIIYTDQGEMSPQVKQSLSGKDPIWALGDTTAIVTMGVEQSAKQAGQQIPDDVLLKAGEHILEILAEDAGKLKIHDYSDEEIGGATDRAMQTYLQMKGPQGGIDQNAAQQDFSMLQQANDAGQLDQMFPGLKSYADGRFNQKKQSDKKGDKKAKAEKKGGKNGAGNNA